MSDYITSILRTLIPSLWGTAIAWLITRVPVLEQVQEELTGIGLVLVAVTIALYYALVRKLEPHLPDWLRPILIGSTKAPAAYVTKPEAVEAVLTDDGQIVDTKTGRHVADGGNPTA